MAKIKKIRNLIFALLGAIYALNSPAKIPPLIDYQVKGVNAPLKNVILRHLEINLNNIAAPLTLKILHEWNKQSLAEIRQVLISYGYFKPSINSRLIYQPNKISHVTYNINPGQLLKINPLNITLHGEGVHDAALLTLIRQFSLQKNNIFLNENYKKMKQSLLNTAITEGYLSAHFLQHQVLINQHFHTATITLALATGQRYYFGPVTFQQTIFNNDFLKRYIPFKVGTPYSSDLLRGLQDNLNRSGYFQHISLISIATTKYQQKIPITVKLTPRPSQQYVAGLGYNTDTGVRGTMGWESRYLNKFGHKLNFKSQLSKIQKSLQSIYIIPGKQPNTDNYTINFAFIRKKLSQIESITEQIGLGSTHQYKRWQRNLFLNYQVERFNYNDRPTVISHLLTPGITFSRTQFDNQLYTLHGYRLVFRMQGAKKNLLSNVSFLQTQVQSKYIFSWDKKSRVILRNDLGFTITPNLSTFPPSLLFYAGGSQNVRGYDYQALGPGRYLLASSVEYQHNIINNFYGAAFFDAGNAINNFPINLKKGIGIGLVWISPLGPMELTLGKALNLPKHPVRLQFSMGIDLA